MYAPRIGWRWLNPYIEILSVSGDRVKHHGVRADDQETRVSGVQLGE